MQVVASCLPGGATSKPPVPLPLSTLSQEEGFFALYRGISPTLLGAIPYEGIKFGAYDTLKQHIPPRGSSSTSTSSSAAVHWKVSELSAYVYFGPETCPLIPVIHMPSPPPPCSPFISKLD